MKVFKVHREKNYKVDMVAKLAASEMVETLMNILIEIVEVQSIEHVLVNTREEGKNSELLFYSI